jgi:hypothetical protein
MGFFPATLIGAGAVLALDTFGSLASLRFKFTYARLAPISQLLWALTGFLAAYSRASRIGGALAIGAMAGGVVGLTEATLGWSISWRLGPGQVPPERATSSQITRIVILVTLRAAIHGAFGGAVGFLLPPA